MVAPSTTGLATRVYGPLKTERSLAALPENTFLVHDRVFRDFEVRLKYRMTTPVANSGLQYRSRPFGNDPYVVAGYQANIVTTNADRTFAMLFDEHARETLAFYGEQAEIIGTATGFRKIVTGCVNSKAAIMAAQKPFPEWNDYVVIAHGNRLIHALNGVVTLDLTDQDPRGFLSEGVFALQIHRDLIMGVQFKDIAVKTLAARPELGGRFMTVPTSPDEQGNCP